MKTIFLGKTTEPTIVTKMENTIYLKTNDYLTTYYSTLEEDKSIKKSILDTDNSKQKYLNKGNFVLVAECCSSLFDVRLALKYKFKVCINNNVIATSTMSKLDAAILTFNLSSDEFPSEFTYESKNLINEALKASPVKMSTSAVIRKIKSELSPQDATIIIEMFDKKIQKRAEKVKLLYSISDNNPNIEFLDIEYGPELIEFMLKNKGDYALNGPMSCGKTQDVILPFFERACELKMFPMLVNGSRVLSKSYFQADDLRHYREAYKAERVQLGWVGTTNSLLIDNKYLDARSLSEVLICDEVENTLNHNCGDAILNGNLESKITALGQYESQYKKSSITLCADALLSNFTINCLAKLSKEAGKKLYVINKKINNKLPIVKVVSKNLNIKLAQESIQNEKKIGVFCDYAHQVNSKFNSIIKSINPKGFNNCSQIDSNFMNTEELANRLSNPDQFAADNQVIYTNGAASVGLSIQNGEYQDIHVFGGGTVTPFDLIQSPGRFRDCETICLNITTGNNSRKTSTEAVLTEILLKERDDAEYLIDELVSFSKNPLAMRVCERIAYKNKLHDDYGNTVLIALEQMGYEIKYVSDGKKESQGRKLNYAGKEAEKTSTEIGIMEAEKINAEAAAIMRASGDVNSQENKFKLSSYELRNFYEVESVRPDLLAFDRFGIGRTFINNLMIARGDKTPYTIEEQFASVVLKKFFRLTGLSPFELGEYNGLTASHFKDFIKNESITIPGHTMTAESAFNLAFPYASLASTYATSTVSSVLSTAFGLKEKKLTNKKIKGKSFTRKLVIPNIEIEYWYNKVKPDGPIKNEVELQKIINPL